MSKKQQKGMLDFISETLGSMGVQGIEIGGELIDIPIPKSLQTMVYKRGGGKLRLKKGDKIKCWMNDNPECWEVDGKQKEIGVIQLITKDDRGHTILLENNWSFLTKTEKWHREFERAE